MIIQIDNQWYVRDFIQNLSGPNNIILTRHKDFAHKFNGSNIAMFYNTISELSNQYELVRVMKDNED